MERIEVKVTEEIIKEGSKNLYLPTGCIGALTLGTLDPKKEAHWGCWDGVLAPKGKPFSDENPKNKFYKAIDKDGNKVDVMELTEPRTIILQEITYEEYIFGR